MAWPDGAKSSRRQASANGNYAIQLTETGERQCRIEVFADSQPIWQLAGCLGTTEDFYFVSNDGKRFWVILAIPEKPMSRKKEKENPSAVMQVVVATLYDQEGRTLRRMRLGDILHRESQDRVRQLGRHFKWLQGVAGVPGKWPRVNDRNEVELDLVDFRTVRLKF